MSENSELKPKNDKRKLFMFGGLLIILVAGAFLSSRLQKTKVAEGKVNFDTYVMSQCPYGSQAEAVIYEAMKGFEDFVNFNIEYIADKNADGTFNSLHGQTEVEGNIYQLCVKKYKADGFWDYLNCQNKNYRDLKSSFESCATEVSADFNQIKTCAEGDEGKTLLEESLNKAKTLNVAGSPTFYLNDKQYNGQRTKVALQRAWCEELNNDPKVCDSLPEDKKFTAYLIKDSRCTKDECDTARLLEQLKTTFTKMELEELDYTTDEGKEFFGKYKLTLLPAVLFDEDVKNTDNYSQVEKYLKQVDDLYNLAIGAVYDPTKEICDNKVDDTANGQVDCDDNDCKEDFACREEKAGQLDLFVMSQCPYGVKAMDAMKEVMDNFGDKLTLSIHYIANENADGSFTSLHGAEEVNEDIRELCAMKYYPTNYLDYILCRNKDITGDFAACAKDFPKIKVCAEGAEGKKLLSEDVKIANSLNIGASPTLMTNNRYVFNGLDAETIKTNFCQYNEVAGCDKTLTGQVQGATNAGSCNN